MFCLGDQPPAPAMAGTDGSELAQAGDATLEPWTKFAAHDRLLAALDLAWRFGYALTSLDALEHTC